MSWALLFSLLPEHLVKRWWDDQWKRTIVFWDYGRGKRQNVQECLDFSAEDWDAVDLFLASLGPLPRTDDAKVKFIMSKLNRKYRPSVQKRLGGGYLYDREKHKTPDYWQSPAETLRDRTGDCDDWGILLYAALRRAGIPSYRLKCVIDEILQSGKPAGYHFHLIYLARYDYEWYTLEGSWYPDSALRRFLNVPHKESTDLYGAILFTFNEEYVWAQRSFSLRPVYLQVESVR